jgi:glycine/D-amino acid oxidase-like deaminating enzyme
VKVGKPPPQADVVIVGGGLFGCAIAYHVASFGREALVLDRGDIGGEASGANSGNLHLQLSPATHRDTDAAWMAQFARQLPFFRAAVSLWRQLAVQLPGDLELRLTGGLMVAETDQQIHALQTKVALERANGLDVELLGSAELRELAPYLGEGFLGAAFCETEGMANSLAAVSAFVDAARYGGAQFFAGRAVNRLAATANGWHVETDGGAIRCRALIIAAGCWSDAIAAMADVTLPLSQRPIHVSVTEASTPLISHLCYHTDLRLTLKQAGNGNVVIGGGWSAAVDAHLDRPIVLRESLARSLWVARRVVPAVGPLRLIRSWAGRNVYTPDGWPILGPVPGRPGLYLAVCNTYGFTLGPLCALLVAESVSERSASFDLRPFSVERFGGSVR